MIDVVHSIRSIPDDELGLEVPYLFTDVKGSFGKDNSSNGRTSTS